MVMDFIPPPLKITFRRPDIPWDLHLAEVVEDPCRLAPDEANFMLYLLNNIQYFPFEATWSWANWDRGSRQQSYTALGPGKHISSVFYWLPENS